MSGAAIAGLLVFVMVDDPLVRAEGSSSCPRPDQVAAQLARFLPARPPDIAADAARVDPAAGGVRIQLWRAGDPTIVGEKIRGLWDARGSENHATRSRRPNSLRGASGL